MKGDTRTMTTQQNAKSVYREIRCPAGPKKLLAKMKTDPDTDAVKRIVDNLLELSCRDCTKTARATAYATDAPIPLRVLHRYNIAGELVESEVEYG